MRVRDREEGKMALRNLRNYIRQDRRPIQEIVREAVRQELSKSRKAG